MSHTTQHPVQVIGGKRSRAFSPTDHGTAVSYNTRLAQEDNMDVESYPASPLAKRRRRYAEHDSPLVGTAFVSPGAMSGATKSRMDCFLQGDINVMLQQQQQQQHSTGTGNMDSMRQLNRLSPQEQGDDENLLRWWERKPTETKEPESHHAKMPICHVCERTFPPLPVPKVKNIMPSNALLAYFSMNKATTKMTTTTTPSCATTSHASTCTFCERPCCQDCMTMCEECQHPFCSFCSTMDYRGRVERHLCLDCSSLLDLDGGPCGNECSGDSSLMVMD